MKFYKLKVGTVLTYKDLPDDEPVEFVVLGWDDDREAWFVRRASTNPNDSYVYLTPEWLNDDDGELGWHMAISRVVGSTE